jgi:predicted nuclease of restriction endonuclease-like (RecB) superfamily
MRLKTATPGAPASAPEVSASGVGRNYTGLVAGIAQLLDAARRASVRAVNAVMTATYWEIGRRIVQFEQGGKARADYGEELLNRLSADLTAKFGRGFSRPNLQRFRLFFTDFPANSICSTVSSELLADKCSTPSSISSAPNPQTLPAESDVATLVTRFPLPWSHYVRLLSVDNPQARAFYETEALRGGWSVRQLDRQISTLFNERTAISRDKAAMLKKGGRPKPEDRATPEEEIKDPLLLEFLGLKDEYSESQLEDALIRHLETFLLELGSDFAFVGRQRRLRIGDEWYRVDLLFFHRRLRCLVIIDLKLGKFTHADAGQMHLYLNYAREHWAHPDENPPVGLILCAQKDAALARYALENLPNKILAAEYKVALPAEKTLAAEIDRTRKLLEARSRT